MVTSIDLAILYSKFTHKIVLETNCVRNSHFTIRITKNFKIDIIKSQKYYIFSENHYSQKKINMKLKLYKSYFQPLGNICNKYRSNLSCQG